ncbi:MAG: hypothetical protein GYA33_16620 [Thermogutta sp.]|nr:hypothetical protein [Thermogutta sp.]
MKAFHRLPAGLFALVALFASSALAQNQYIGYVYPAGGRQGTTFPVRLGGQALLHPSGVLISGEGVSARLVDYYPVYNNEELALLRQQLAELKKKETTVDDGMVAKMTWWEFPAPIGPAALPELLSSGSNGGEALPEKEAAKQKLIERIERIFAEDERFPAVQAHTELVFVEVTIDPDAKPGRREIRVVTKRGISNPLPFFVDQVPEVARKPMKTSQKQVLGKEWQAQRKRPPEEEELQITLPCTMNGQVAAGEVNRYRFLAAKGQRLVISVKARALIPYVPDAVPGWFQPIIRLSDADGRELAFADDFRFHPDPVMYFEVPDDGEYVLSITDALFRGRESFVYRVTIGELPYLTDIFPLGGRVGEAVKLEMSGWNLEDAAISPPPPDAAPGIHLLSASKGPYVTNPLPFALDTLPECLDQESNDAAANAQKVALPIIVNGRTDKPGDWDVFEVEGRAGETVVAEVLARRLGSPLDSFLKVTTADGKVLAVNDDHFDAASGLNTDHADSYLMVKLPADGKYYIHVGDTRRQSGKEFAYRLRISPPRPDFELRVVPSRVILRSNASVALTVYAIRKDGFDGPITLGFKDLPAGLESPGATLPAGKEVVQLAVKTTLAAMDAPVNVKVIGTAKVGEQEIVHEAVPCEDVMQAFAWRHLLPADTLPLLVYDPGYQPPTDRIRPPIPDEMRPKDVKPTLQRSQVNTYLRQIERLYQEWLLTDEFANREIAKVEAQLIQ